MFGGFNSQYFNDLHYINVTDGFARPKKYWKNVCEVRKMVNRKQSADMCIETSDGEFVYCHKGILMMSFDGQAEFDMFVGNVSKK